jgi:hypothetical protein
MPLAAITDDTVLHDLMWRHTEDATFSSGLWTLTEIANYLTERQNRFNGETGLVLTHTGAVLEAGPVLTGTGGATLPVDPFSRIALPTDWISTHRVSWRSADRTYAVPRGDRFAAYMLGDSPFPLMPLAYDDSSGGTRVLELLPAIFPSTGAVDLLYVGTLTALTLTPGNPVTLTVPFDFVPYLVYGVMSDMLSKSGRGQDLERARYCELRYQEGVAVAALLAEGFA